MTCFTTQTDNYEALQNKTGQISDLDRQELFLADYSTCCKQSKHKGDILQQISDEIELIHTTKEMLDEEEDDFDVASLKVQKSQHTYQQNQ